MSDLVFEGPTAVITTLLGGLAFAWFWFVVPLIRRARLVDEPGAQ